MEFSITLNKDTSEKLSGFLTNLVRGTEEVTEFVELHGFTPEEIKFEIELGGTTRTVTLGDPNAFRNVVDITDEVAVDDETGRPEFESMAEITTDLLPEYMGVLAEETDPDAGQD